MPTPLKYFPLSNVQVSTTYAATPGSSPFVVPIVTVMDRAAVVDRVIMFGSSAGVSGAISVSVKATSGSDGVNTGTDTVLASGTFDLGDPAGTRFTITSFTGNRVQPGSLIYVHWNANPNTNLIYQVVYHFI